MPRPREPLINRTSAVDAAIRIIDTEGLDSFSLPRLARELGVRAPSLYHHFADKSEILAAVSRTIAGATVMPRKPADPQKWVDWLVQLALNFRTAILRHRHAAPILLQFPPREELTHLYEEVAAYLEHCGVPRHLHVRILDGMEKLSVSATVSEALRPHATRRSIFPGVDSATHPTLARAVADNPLTPKQLFEATVRAFLAGTLASDSALA
ncbi:TetR family transcriptional regulator [Cryptosporangium aurantiacum]|uniref:Transcriptional regulator, TetR family n=1 Tax=Cryptosporangium aurantiacum TaxID=134849 RepID=A0A1M7RKQ7_9ACTN|nr:TetR family transcriptional regulator [Cryptosporangium aurantiacum]SHN46658.1 transcriptional regulator, TetR family [Cryptosporangium aurantiacum]